MTSAEQAAQARQQARYAAEDAVRALTMGDWPSARVFLQETSDLLDAADRLEVGNPIGLRGRTTA